MSTTQLRCHVFVKDRCRFELTRAAIDQRHSFVSACTFRNVCVCVCACVCVSESEVYVCVCVCVCVCVLNFLPRVRRYMCTAIGCFLYLLRAHTYLVLYCRGHGAASIVSPIFCLGTSTWKSCTCDSCPHRFDNCKDARVGEAIHCPSRSVAHWLGASGVCSSRSCLILCLSTMCRCPFILQHIAHY